MESKSPHYFNYIHLAFYLCPTLQVEFKGFGKAAAVASTPVTNEPMEAAEEVLDEQENAITETDFHLVCSHNISLNLRVQLYKLSYSWVSYVFSWIFRSFSRSG